MTAITTDCLYRTPACAAEQSINHEKFLKFTDAITRALVAAMDNALRVHETPKWMTEDLPARLAGVLALEDDWDSYGGIAPSQQVGEAVIQLLRHVAPGEMPTIEANPSGMAIVEWERHDDFVSVSVADYELLVEYEIDGVSDEFELFGNADTNRLRGLIGSLG